MDLTETFTKSFIDPDNWYSKTLEELEELKTHAGTKVLQEANLVTPDLPHVYPGSLKVDGNLTLSRHVLVLGDLDVTGIINVPPEHHILMVAGNVKCRNLFSYRGYLLVAGKVEATEGCFVFGEGLSKFGEGLASRLFLHDESWNNLNMDDILDEDPSTTDNIKAEEIVLMDNSEESQTKLRKILLPEFFVSNDISVDAIIKQAEKGQPILSKK